MDRWRGKEEGERGGQGNRGRDYSIFEASREPWKLQR